ncbi:MAG: tol-pal system protein YbgF [Gammaproteobacteria bacterium]|nr:tol-pal system protein YbgF [Gammaproteobacteria bacterium]MDH5801433.1 tol-pal system protein YbgF [Gammaproteobacteria bacterium]
MSTGRHNKNKTHIAPDAAIKGLVVILMLAIVSSVTARENVTPEAGMDTQRRLDLVERRLQPVIEVMTKVDKLQQEMQKLVGQMEEIAHKMESIKKRQRDLYVDIDRRIGEVEKKAEELAQRKAEVPASNAAGSPAAASVSVALEQEAYERAFELLKQGNYELAIASFKLFLETYPTAEYADNAQYWLGEANYVQRHYQVALEEFNKVLDNYPRSNKRADAMLKMGYTYVELGKNKRAKVILGNVVKHFPDTTAARLAGKRLQTLN